MATIEKRQDSTGTTTYRAKIRIKGYPAQSATFDRLSKAKEWAKSTEAAIKEGRHFKTAEAKKHTLGDMIDRYIRSVLPQKSASSRTHQEQQLTWWKDQLGDRLLSDMTPALIAEYRDRLQETPYRKTGVLRTDSPDALTLTRRTAYRSNATVVRYLAALSHAFTVAMKEWGWVEENPVVKVTKPKEARGRVRFLSDEERGRLLAACRESRSPDLYLAVVLALSTGARQQEILGLKWKDVDLERRVAVLHETKNGERRVLPLAGVALEMLRQRKRERKKERKQAGEGDALFVPLAEAERLIFPSRAAHSRKDKTQPFRHPPRRQKAVDLRTPFETALKKAQIEDFRWHDLRHSAASYLAMNGASLAEIAEILGHKTLAMVKRYAHLSEQHTASVVERMNEMIFGRETDG